MPLPDAWYEPVRWWLAANETETLSAFVSESWCPKCEAKPGEPCVTVVSMNPKREAGKETPHHALRINKGRIGWNVHKGACRLDPEMKELEKQVRALSIQVARARRIKALQDLVAHLTGQVEVLVESGWKEPKALRQLRKALTAAQASLDKLIPPERPEPKTS
jgi:hypothetical protein